MTTPHQFKLVEMINTDYLHLGCCKIKHRLYTMAESVLKHLLFSKKKKEENILIGFSLHFCQRPQLIIIFKMKLLQLYCFAKLHSPTLRPI